MENPDSSNYVLDNSASETSSLDNGRFENLATFLGRGASAPIASLQPLTTLNAGSRPASSQRAPSHQASSQRAVSQPATPQPASPPTRNNDNPPALSSRAHQQSVGSQQHVSSHPAQREQTEISQIPLFINVTEAGMPHNATSDRPVTPHISDVASDMLYSISSMKSNNRFAQTNNKRPAQPNTTSPTQPNNPMANHQNYLKDQLTLSKLEKSFENRQSQIMITVETLLKIPTSKDHEKIIIDNIHSKIDKWSTEKDDNGKLFSIQLNSIKDALNQSSDALFIKLKEFFGDDSSIYLKQSSIEGWSILRAMRSDSVIVQQEHKNNSYSPNYRHYKKFYKALNDLP